MTYDIGSVHNLTTKPNGEKEFKLSDHLGNTRMTIEKVSGTVKTYDYEPFGAVLSQNSSTPRLSFIDKEKDKESNLGDFGVRKYDDNSGRFLSIDPLWETSLSQTPYQYSMNNPLRLIDPSGKVPNDYFNNETGKYLGTDNAKTDDIKLISKENFDAGKLSESKYVDGPRVSETIATNIFNHYYSQLGYDINELGAKQIYSTSSAVAQTVQNWPEKDSGINIYVDKLQMSNEGVLQNKYDVMNLLVHEHKHVSDYQNGTSGDTKKEREGSATIVQMQHSSWNKCSTAWQTHMIGIYGVYIQSYLNKINKRK